MTKSTVGEGRAPRPKTGGRVAGTPNKATREFRETVAKVLESNAENVGLWIQQVADGVGDAKPDPGKALDLLAKLAEFAAPKLARTEHTGADGGPMLFTKVQRTVVDPTK